MTHDRVIKPIGSGMMTRGGPNAKRESTLRVFRSLRKAGQEGGGISRKGLIQKAGAIGLNEPGGSARPGTNRRG
jgi:hypothetical protein